jgi:hypothetical protein
MVHTIVCLSKGMMDCHAAGSKGLHALVDSLNVQAQVAETPSHNVPCCNAQSISQATISTQDSATSSSPYLQKNTHVV